MNNCVETSVLLEAFRKAPPQTAVLTIDGKISYVNESWHEFSADNEGVITTWEGINYHELCQTVVDSPESSPDEKRGAGAVLRAFEWFRNGCRETIEHDYSCHAPDKKRYFHMTMTPFEQNGDQYVLVMHNNITESYIERKALKEEKKQARKEAQTDDLTGALQREPFMDELEQAMGDDGAYLLLLDLDDFKTINDTAGHPVGDDILKKCASILNDVVRDDDVVGRYGGDEFTVLLHDMTDSQAQSVAARCQEQFARWEHDALSEHKSSFSVGVVGHRPSIATTRDWVEAADRALYRAKHHDDGIHQN